MTRRYAHRLLNGRFPVFAYSTGGAGMGELMVAEGLGVTVLPDFSVVGDPLERQDALVCRPVAGDRARVLLVLLVLLRRRSASVPVAARALHEAFVRRARRLGGEVSRPGRTAPPPGTRPTPDP